MIQGLLALQVRADYLVRLGRPALRAMTVQTAIQGRPERQAWPVRQEIRAGQVHKVLPVLRAMMAQMEIKARRAQWVRQEHLALLALQVA
ncbi:MAG: hypothetical protein ACLQFI_18320 [Methylocella sp.]